MDWINIVTNVGFPIALIVFGLGLVAKHMPTLIKVWGEFADSIKSLSESVSDNTTITTKHYQENITVQDHLKKAIKLLEDHHDNAVQIKDDMDELRKLFIELAERLQEVGNK